MTSIFLDTSALVKYYYPEVGSEKVEAIILKAKQVYLCQIAVTEFASALIKKMRAGTLEKEKQIVVWNVFLDDLNTGQMLLIQLDERHYFKAADIIRDYGRKKSIRTSDFLQLVAALDVPDTKFIAADKFLSRIAIKVGLNVEKI